MEPRDLWSPPVSQPYVAPEVPQSTAATTGQVAYNPQSVPDAVASLPQDQLQPQQIVLSTQAPLAEATAGSAAYAAFATDQLIAQENARVSTFENPLPAPKPKNRIITAIGAHRALLLIVLVTVLVLGAGTAFAMSAVHKVTGGTLASTTGTSGGGTVSKKTSSSAATTSSDDESSSDDEDSASSNEDNSDADSNEEDDSTTTNDEDNQDSGDTSSSDEEGDDEGDTGTVDPGDDGTDSTVTPTPTPVPSTPVASNPHKFTIATWNVKTDNTKNAGTEVLDLLTKSQIIGLQTLRTKAMRDSVKSKVICSSCAYSGYLASYSGSDAGPSDMPIIWNKAAFTIVGSGSNRKMCDAASSKTYSYAARYATWVKLQSKVNNKQFYVIDTHTMSPDESAGKPGKDSLLLSRYQTHMTNLKALIGELQKSNVPIYVLGTFNVDYRYDRYGYTSYFPYASFKTINVRSSWDLMGLSGISSSAGTLSGGKRLIDYVFTWQRSDVVANAIAVATSTHGSDHYAAYFTSTIK